VCLLPVCLLARSDVQLTVSAQLVCTVFSAKFVSRVKLQEAELPLRNGTSVMHLFIVKLLSIAVMTYTYVYHL